MNLGVISGGGSEGRLPVFVFPNTLTFYTNDQSTHKQVLTLYNPYDFTLNFKVLCTSPKKYSVVDSEGSINARCCGDIVVRHKDICVNNEGLRDKFRIHTSEMGERTVIGKKDVPSVLLPRKVDSSQADDNFESLASMTSSATSGSREPISALNARQFTLNPRAQERAGPGWLIIMAAVLCIIALMLPHVGDNESRIPEYLQLSLNQKLIAAYVLGLVTMAILRSGAV